MWQEAQGTLAWPLVSRKPVIAVVKAGVQPGIKRGVAGFASGREFRRHVIGIHGLLKIRQVARHAGRRESQVIARPRRSCGTGRIPPPRARPAAGIG